MAYMGTRGTRILFLFIMFSIGAIIWNIPTPGALSSQSWHLFAIFIATIFGIITQPMPMGAVALIGLTASILTNTLTTKQALQGFSSPVVWLVLAAFFIARAFINTGLGKRIAFYFISKLGGSTLGLSYGLIFTDFLLAPFIPSVAARGGGIIYPIAQSLTREYGNESGAGITQIKRTGAFLMNVCFQSTVISSAMFLTAMAGNPLIVSIAEGFGVHITWFEWAKIAIVPGLMNLLILPLALYKLLPPGIKYSDKACEVAKARLEEMEKLTRKEAITLCTFCLLIILWVFGSSIGVDSTGAALAGCSILLISGVLSWDDAIGEKGAWRTFIWFAVLLSMSDFLTQFGMMDWLGSKFSNLINPTYLGASIALVLGLYFYLHYFFASATAHITVMYGTFLLVLLNYNVPGVLISLVLAFLSILSGGLTHYGMGTAPIFFGSNYCSIREWWKIGFIISILNILLWGIIGALWWKFIGLW